MNDGVLIWCHFLEQLYRQNETFLLNAIVGNHKPCTIGSFSKSSSRMRKVWKRISLVAVFESKIEYSIQLLLHSNRGKLRRNAHKVHHKGCKLNENHSRILRRPFTKLYKIKAPHPKCSQFISFQLDNLWVSDYPRNACHRRATSIFIVWSFIFKFV